MNVLLCWLGLLLLFALATWLGRRLGLVPIVSQLLLASIGLPVLQSFAPEGLGGAQLLAPAWVPLAYGLAFTLVLGHILGEVVGLRPETPSLKIALPSFLVPFACGLACAVWLLPASQPLAVLATGLLFALTAIPVLYLYLSHLGYPGAVIRRHVQAAILMDLACWSLFGLAQGSSDPATLLWPLLAATLPLALHLLRVSAPLAYSLPFFALLLVLQQLKLNALLFGIAYLALLAALRRPFQAPLRTTWQGALQTWLAVPLILAFGMLQVNWQEAWQGLSWLQFAALLALPILSKLAGNWLGLSWAEGSLAASSGKWQETLLLNCRGLTEIVFLNLLFQQRIIGAQLYFALMLMGLIATLLPALLRHPHPAEHQSLGRSPYEIP